MSILHLYQLAFITTIISTVVLANWARKQREIPNSSAIAGEPQYRRGPKMSEPYLKAVAPDLRKLTAPVTDSVGERIAALDKLFDENVISVEEYVELRKRAMG